MKPLFRWVIGDVRNEGFCILSDAIKNLLKLYKNDFDFLICSNATKSNSKKKLKEISKKFEIQIYEQSWNDLPINQSLIMKTNDQIRQGTFWKLCPPRLRLEAHEIICDNDLVFVNPIDAITEFLDRKNAILMLKEDAFCVGKYFYLFEEKENYNSGLYGLPPYYDFAKEIKATWSEKKFQDLMWRDEQGLVTGTLKKFEHITIQASEIIHLFDHGRCFGYDYDFVEEKNVKTRLMKNMKFNKFNFSVSDKGYHFLGANRNNHELWKEYKRKNLFL
jgi:hypothetical protein